MKTEYLTVALTDAADAIEHQLLVCSKNKLITTSLNPKTVWITPFAVANVTGIVHKKIEYKVKAHIIHFCKPGENGFFQTATMPIMDVAAAFFDKIAEHKYVEQVTDFCCQPNTKPLTGYGDNSVVATAKVTVIDCCI